MDDNDIKFSIVDLLFVGYLQKDRDPFLVKLLFKLNYKNITNNEKRIKIIKLLKISYNIKSNKDLHNLIIKMKLLYG